MSSQAGSTKKSHFLFQYLGFPNSYGKICGIPKSSGNAMTAVGRCFHTTHLQNMSKILKSNWSNWSLVCVALMCHNLGNPDLLGTFYPSLKSKPPCTLVQPVTHHSCLGPNHGLPKWQRSAVSMISQSECWLFKSNTYPELDEYPGVVLFGVCSLRPIPQIYYFSNLPVISLLKKQCAIRAF